MKKYIFFLCTILFFTSCEDVIDVPLDNATPKLVIDANILWQKGTIGNEQKIKLTTTSDFYSNTAPTVSGAVVFITNNSSNTIFTFSEIVANSGEYICTNFLPIINESYTLTINYNGETYTATEKLLATPTINSIQQTLENGFGEEEIQVKFFYQDNGSEDNFYLIGAKNPNLSVLEFGVIEDKFFQGNEMFGLYRSPDLKKDDVLKLSLQSISQRYYNYMNKLLNIAGSSNGSPFATPPATLRGNIVNSTSESNYPLGYFHLSEIDVRNYVIQ